MRLTAFEYTRNCTPGTGQFRRLQPNHQSRALQSDVEGRQGKIAVANPLIPCVRVLYQGPESGNVLLFPMRLPDGIQTDNRRAGSFAKLPRQSSLAAASATQDNDSRHDRWLLRI